MKLVVGLVLACASTALAAGPSGGKSKLDPKAPSRWSNAGAMHAAAERPEATAPLPERVLPRPELTTAARLRAEDDDRFSVHLSVFGSHLETAGQLGRDVDLWRGRATFTYLRIAGSDFGLHLDAEYRGRIGGSRPEDHRINALYATWGLTEVERPSGPSFGVGLGRIAIPEAGHAQTDGLSLRLRIGEHVRLGAFGGITGSPYGYNFRLAKPESISTDWVNGGAFVRARGERFSATVAGLVTYARVGKTGLDRVALFVDGGWAPSDTLDLFGSAFLDVLPSGQPIQSAELAASYRPIPEVDLRLSLERFGTLRYDASGPYAYRVDPTDSRVEIENAAGNLVEGVLVDENGEPIPAFDGQFEVATYSRLRLRGGWSRAFGKLELEPIVDLSLVLREPGAARPPLELSPLVVLPRLAVALRHEDVIDVTLSGTVVVDEVSQADALLGLSLSRELFGLRLGVDGRVIVGAQLAVEGGGELTYALPIDALPGRLSVFAGGRYLREDVTLLLPNDDDTLADDVALPVRPVQESFFAFGGVDWRL